MEKDAPVPLSVATEEVRLDPKYFGEGANPSPHACRKTKRDSNQPSIAISFYFNGTALCFANTKRRDSPFKLAGEVRGAVILFFSLSARAHLPE